MLDFIPSVILLFIVEKWGSYVNECQRISGQKKQARTELIFAKPSLAN